MRRVRYLARAKDDMVAIKRYIEQRSRSREVAINFTKQLRAQCVRIAELPGELGRARPELAEGLRSIAHGNYVIFFRYLASDVEIVTIIEGHRDIGRLFDS